MAKARGRGRTTPASSNIISTQTMQQLHCCACPLGSPATAITPGRHHHPRRDNPSAACTAILQTGWKPAAYNGQDDLIFARADSHSCAPGRPRCARRAAERPSGRGRRCARRDAGRSSGPRARACRGPEGGPPRASGAPKRLWRCASKRSLTTFVTWSLIAPTIERLIQVKLWMSNVQGM